MDRLPENKLPALRVMTMPADANQNGDIFGGCDHVARRHRRRHSRRAHGARPRGDRRRERVIFKQPVQVGDVLSFYTDW